MGHHVNTGFALIGTFLVVGVAALLLTIAHVRLNDITSNVTDEKLESAKSLAIWSYVLAWIAAGLLLLLSFFYFTHGSIFENEWPHLIFFIIIVGLIVASGILALLAASDIRESNITDNESADAYLYWGAGLLGVSILIILITGIWRVYHRSENRCNPQYPGEKLPADCAKKALIVKRETGHFPQFIDEPKVGTVVGEQGVTGVQRSSAIPIVTRTTSPELASVTISPDRTVRKTFYEPRTNLPVSRAREVRVSSSPTGYSYATSR